MGDIFCVNCGQKLPAEAKFCFACGQRVETGGYQDAAEVVAENTPCQQGDMSSPAENDIKLTLAEFREQAPSQTAFREQLLSYRKSLPSSWDYNAFVGILLGVRGPKHGDAACMNFAIGQGDNGNNTKKNLEAKGLMSVFEKYKGKNINPSILLSDVEDEIVAVAPDYAEIRKKFHEIVFAGVGGNGKAAEGASAPEIPTTLEEPQEADPSCFEVEDCDGGSRITKYTGPKEGTVSIPAHIGGKKVVSIGKDAFSHCESLIRIIIPNGVTEIDCMAFSDCKSLTRVVIPTSVTRIGHGAFAGCESLIDITIPDGVTEIAEYLFFHCYSLTSVAIPASVTRIGHYAFVICKNLTGVIIPDGVTEIGTYAFSSCASLTSITIPDSVTRIDYRAFYYCTRLTDVTIPDRLVQYSNTAFEDTPWFKSLGDFAIVDHVLVAYWGNDEIVTIPDSVTEIDGGVFYRESLTGVIIPKSVTEIGSSAFWNCTSLTSVIIPEGVTKIGGSAFDYCDSLTHVTIPKSVTEIGRGAFGHSYYLTIHTPAGSAAEVYAKENNIRIETISVSKPKAPVIPEDIQKADPSDFYVEKCTGGCRIRKYWGLNTGSTELVSVVIPSRIDRKKVVEIGERLFAEGVGLLSVTIPDGVKEIGGKAFAGCLRLSSVAIPNSVTKIGKKSFDFCESLTCVAIPNGVTKIAEGTFGGCLSLTSITIPDSVTEIGSAAFANCHSLTSLTIPDSVTEIGNGAFANCHSLTSLTIPDSVTQVGAHAFNDCDKLTICAPAGSVAELYAKKYGIPFRPL